MLLLIEVTMHPRRNQVTTWYSGKWLLCIQDFLPDATAVKGSLCILTASGMPKTETIDWRLFFKCTAHTRSSKKKLWRNRLLQATAVRGYHAFKEKQVIMHPARPKAVDSERARPGGGHSILGLPQDLHILGPEKKTLNWTPVTMANSSWNGYYVYWTF